MYVKLLEAPPFAIAAEAGFEASAFACAAQAD